LNTPDEALTYRKPAKIGKLEVIGDARHSTKPNYGYLVRTHRGSAPIAVQSKQLSSKDATLSPTDAEANAAVEGSKTLMWIVAIMNWMGIEITEACDCYTDNTALINQVESEIPTSASRYYHVRLQALRKWSAEGKIKMKFVPGEDNCADLLTRALPEDQFLKLKRELMGW
jgi:hypothetical protein